MLPNGNRHGNAYLAGKPGELDPDVAALVEMAAGRDVRDLPHHRRPHRLGGGGGGLPAGPRASLSGGGGRGGGTGLGSRGRYGQGHLLSTDEIAWFARVYFGTAAPVLEWRASPLRADLAGVAPAVIVTAGFNPLADEGAAYARAWDRCETPFSSSYVASSNAVR